MSEQIVDVYAARREANNLSKAWAARDGEPWSQDEEDILVEFWIDLEPRDRDEVAVSQVLERTIEACRVRCELIRARLGVTQSTTVTVTRTVTQTTVYHGTMDADEDRWWDPSYYTKEKR